MFRKIIIAIVALGLAGCASGSTGNLTGKERLKSAFIKKFETEGQDLFEDEDQIAEADRPRAFNCVVDALIYDMSNAQANRLADMLERKIPPEKDFVLYWAAPKEANASERREQVEDRLEQICPDLAQKIL